MCESCRGHSQGFVLAFRAEGQQPKSGEEKGRENLSAEKQHVHFFSVSKNGGKFFSFKCMRKTKLYKIISDVMTVGFRFLAVYLYIFN